MCRRCFALLLAALLLACVAAPALADEGGPVTSTGTIWSNWAGESPDWLQTMIGSVAPSACPVSSDGKHHGKVIDKNPNGNNWIAKCSYCSDTFPVYDDDMQNAYNGHVGDMQTQYGATNIDSLGLSVFYPFGWRYTSSSSLCTIENSSSLSPAFKVLLPYTKKTTIVATSTRFLLPDGTYTFVIPSAHNIMFLNTSLPATSCIYISASLTGSSIDRVLGSFNAASGGTMSFSASSSKFYSVSLRLDTLEGLYGGSYGIYESTPYIAGVPLFPADSSIVAVDTRYGNFVGNLGYYRDGDQITVNENITLVNENTNSFYSFLSDSSRPIESWTYDYATRTYELTLEGGEKVTVVYGDEAITITEGDTTYTVYYVVGPGEEEPLPTPTPTPTPPVTPTPTPPVDPTPTPTAPVDPTPTPTAPVDPTDPPRPIDPDNPPDTSGWGLLDFLKGILDAILNFGKWLLKGLTDLLSLLFLPKEETTSKIQGAVAEKLPFVSDLQSFGDDLVSVLNNPAASAKSMRFTTVVDFSRKTSGVSYGDGQVDILDMSWYMEYKPLVDDIIEGVAWLVFLWNLYGAIPGIIHGGASALQSGASIQKHVDKDSGGDD